MDFATFGETMALLLADFGEPIGEATGFQCHTAGSESTVAIGLARLGLTAGWISRLGDDPLGHQVLRRIRGEGVDTTQVQRIGTHPTGLLVRGWGVDRIDVQYYRRDSAASTLCPEDIDAEYVSSSRLLFVSGITPALSESARRATFSALEVATEAGVTIAFDPNFRAKLWSPTAARPVLRDILSHTQILLAGTQEISLLIGEDEPPVAARALLDSGLSIVAIKQGSRGAYVASEAEQFQQPAHPVQVLDPVGAGDAFTAGFLGAWLEDRPLRTCACWGTRNGAASVATKGDIEGLLRREVMIEATSADVHR